MHLALQIRRHDSNSRAVRLLRQTRRADSAVAAVSSDGNASRPIRPGLPSISCERKFLRGLSFCSCIFFSRAIFLSLFVSVSVNLVHAMVVSTLPPCRRAVAWPIRSNGPALPLLPTALFERALSFRLPNDLRRSLVFFVQALGACLPQPFFPCQSRAFLSVLIHVSVYGSDGYRINSKSPRPG